MNTTYQQLEKMVNKNIDQVFLMSCPAHFPFCFARHAWFVINKKGILSRWEVLHSKTIPVGTHWGFMYKNAYTKSPFQGIRMFSFSKKYLWKPKLLSVIEGNNASKLIDVIEKSPQLYPFLNTYVATGPNSNTYAQWILDACPDLKIKLSWMHIGKNFKR